MCTLGENKDLIGLNENYLYKMPDTMRQTIQTYVTIIATTTTPTITLLEERSIHHSTLMHTEGLVQGHTESQCYSWELTPVSWGPVPTPRHTEA